MNKKQKILAIIGLSLILFTLVANQVLAQATSTPTTEPSATPVTIGRGPLELIFSFINNIVFFPLVGIFVNLGGFLVNFALLINYDLINNPLVNTGWQISRDLANLGFVLFIIIIAIATILRFQQYGAKNTLGKLIAVALLVNFSLVFAGVFIDFSDMLTRFFISRIDISNSQGLATSLTSAFNVHRLLMVRNDPGIANLIASFGGGLATGIVSSIFIIIFTLLAALTLLALAVMLLIRFVSMSILLVLVPLACLFAILPATKNLWDTWCKNFMKWILFAPAASFFLYLAVAMSVGYGKKIETLATISQGVGTTNPITFGNLLIDEPAKQIGHMIIIIGVMLGGLIAANSMGIAGSKAFLGVAQATGKWARGALGRMGAGIATRPLRGTQAQKLIEGMQKTGLGGGRFARAIGAPVRTLGGALSTAGVQQGEKAVQQSEARLKNRFANDRNLALALPTLSHTDQIAAVKRLTKNKTMNLVDERVLDSIIGNKDTKNIFKRYGAGNVYEDFTKAAGRNYEMVTAETSTEKKKAAKEFHSTYTPKDYENFRTKSVFEDKNSDAIIAGIIHDNPGALAKLMPKLKTVDLNTFNKKLGKIFDEDIDVLIHNIEPAIDIGSKIGVDAKKKLDWLKTRASSEDYNRFEQINRVRTRSLAKRAMGEEAPPASPPAA